MTVSFYCRCFEIGVDCYSRTFLRVLQLPSVFVYTDYQIDLSILLCIMIVTPPLISAIGFVLLSECSLSHLVSAKTPCPRTRLSLSVSFGACVSTGVPQAPASGWTRASG